jgi:hypothetical protein
VIVRFRKTGVHRYGVFVERGEALAVWINPAPGFDEYLPHDLLHFVAEAEWGLDGAVFGQLAAGGDAGIFVPADKALLSKQMRRRKRAQRTKPKPRGRRSELLAGILEVAWYARRRNEPLPADWEERLAAARVERAEVDAVVARLDGFAERWHALRIGESIELTWPRPEGRRHRARTPEKRGPHRTPQRV